MVRAGADTVPLAADNTSTPEDPMEAKLKLNLDQLTVESFEAGHSEPTQENANLATCMDTDCGRIRCCA
jgi:hypothetical protein